MTAPSENEHHQPRESRADSLDDLDSRGQPETVSDFDDVPATNPRHFGETTGGEAPAWLEFDEHGQQIVDEKPPRASGPGIWESIAWIALFVFTELAVGVVWTTIAATLHFVSTGENPGREQLQEIVTRQMPYLLAVVKGFEVLLALVLIRWRFGPKAFRLLGFRPIPLTHVGIAALIVLPTAVMSGQLYALFLQFWEWLAQFAPFLADWNAGSSVETVQEMARTAPWGLLVLAVAVFPALNEEFLFRGLIGRGLVGRYGIVFGIGLTSILFAAVHMSPVHAAALIPLAIVMHVAYLSSGSIWLPVLIHFVNNAMSVIMMIWAVRSAEEAPEMAQSPLDFSLEPLILFSSAFCVAMAIWMFWRMRVEWRIPDGSRWDHAAPAIDSSDPSRGEPAKSRSWALPAVSLAVSLIVFAVSYVIVTLRLVSEAQADVGVFLGQ